MLRKLRRLSELSPGELLVFLQLVFFALSASLALRAVSPYRVIKLLSMASANSLLRRFPLLHRQRDYAQLTVLADLAARAIRPKGPCLFRALNLFWLLLARGEPVQLLIGVRKEGAVLNSHAWVESHERVFGDREESTVSFATLLRF
jgi:Transglutaminase-like superfamily